MALVRGQASIRDETLVGGVDRQGDLEAVVPHRVADPSICGEVAPGFEEVAAAFRRNFAARGELGAACAIYWRVQR